MIKNPTQFIEGADNFVFKIKNCHDDVAAKKIASIVAEKLKKINPQKLSYFGVFESIEDLNKYQEGLNA